jgi:hypothetical protein
MSATTPSAPVPRGDEWTGDEAPPGTPGTGENVCRRCGGSGRIESGQTFPHCKGTGKVTTGIGGA